MVGFFVGGGIGFSAEACRFSGQLPLGTVITRGSNLSGLDRLLVSTAETSFNYMMVGTILGAIGGFVIGLLALQAKPQQVA